ncbi:hypothetical protein [Pseudoxanthomonas sp. LH2527]|uniref:hypothetical protein n=1 Tax=Pseudoxanthomonas sp. LH2527 TaxID=2923249 RepID=UPI001F130C71|nr:hypothetical protein [Pseudoxanthomonas sp. LH2527]
MQQLRRLHYVWSWRARYWWLDTRGGEIAHLVVFAFAVLVCILQLIKMAVAAIIPPPPGEPVKAIYWWVVQLIIMIVAAVISYAMRPKPQAPQPQAADAPTVEDGLAVKHHFGTCWVTDEFLLAWRLMGTVAIKTKGGKK